MTSRTPAARAAALPLSDRLSWAIAWAHFDSACGLAILLLMQRI